MSDDVKIKVSLDGADSVEKGLKGIGDGAGKADSKLGGLVSGGLAGAGVALVGFATAAAVAGGALVASVVDQYAQYEQNIGGIETMFGDSAGKMKQYAADAYKTAGLSANEYMSQATSFSAALLQGLGGDTEKAADVANRAITDMSDNAAKFGSNIGDIQNAYQGFAKQNYTMLDNLKLGYGGTAEEMARLVNESGILADGVTVDASTINDVSYDQIIAAIGAVQDKMGITGTTAKESAQTISGSIDTLKGAWTNLLTGLGDSNADVGALASNVIDSLQQVLTNIAPIIDNIGSHLTELGPKLGDMSSSIVDSVAKILPVIINAGVAIVQGLLSGISSALPGLIGAILPGLISLVEVVADIAPQLITAGAQAISQLAIGIGNAMPTLIPKVIEGVIAMATALVNAAPMLLGAGLTLIMGLAEGILTALPILIEALPGIVSAIVDFLVNALPTIIETGQELLMAIIAALPQVMIALSEAGPQIFSAILMGLLTVIPLMIQAGIDLFSALINGMPTIITTILAALPGMTDTITNTLIASAPQMTEAGVQLFVALISAMPQIISIIVDSLPLIISALENAFRENQPAIKAAGVRLLQALVENMPAIVNTIKGAIPAIINGIQDSIGDGLGQMISAGYNLITGMWQGMANAKDWVISRARGLVDDIVSSIQSAFGIKSPSRRLRDEVGQYLPQGIGVGVELHAMDAIKPIQKLNARIMDEAGKLNTTVAFTHDEKLTQTTVPMRPVATDPGRIAVDASLDTDGLSSAIVGAFAESQQGQDQAVVSLDKASIKSLATEIVNGLRLQSRQGVNFGG